MADQNASEEREFWQETLAEFSFFTQFLQIAL